MSLSVKHRYYYRKKYLAEDSTERQNAVEEAIARHLVKRLTYGLFSVPVVGKPGPNFTYSFSSGGSDPLEGHDADGLFVSLGAEPYLEDIASKFTTPSAGNQKYLTVVMRMARTLTQYEVEKLTFTSVPFREEASFLLYVLEGAEAPNPGPPVKPSLAAETGLYVCDILVTDTDVDASTTTVEIDTTRLKLDPISEAADRGLDGITQQLAFIGSGASTIRFRDIQGSALSLEQALLGMLGAPTPPDASNRGALLSDIGAGTIGGYNKIGPAGVLIAAGPGQGLFNLTPYLGSITSPRLVLVKGLTHIHLNGLFGPLNIHSVAYAWTPSEALIGPDDWSYSISNDARVVASCRIDGASNTSKDSVTDRGMALVVPEYVGGAWQIGWRIGYNLGLANLTAVAIFG